jgi:hypothetical protein
MGREREIEKLARVFFCMDDAIVELIELGSSSTQARARRKVKRRPYGE